MSIATERRHTPEDLLTMPDADRFELVNGELVERNMGSESGWIGSNLLGLVFIWNRDRKYGWGFGAEGSYQCFSADPARVRKPVVSFVRAGRLPGAFVRRGHMPAPPDLAVEVVSPNDSFSEVNAKAEEYLRAGVRLVWVVDPDTRAVSILRADGTATRLHANDELSGEDVLPDFSCLVAELFAPAASPQVGQ
jgi:Uma2 family endonuclease